ncbi:MAG: hypothetical protein NVS1B11_34240 [Terriglobales bacterium]
MKIFISLCLLFNFVASPALNGVEQSEVSTVVLQENTPVKLRLGRTISSSEAHIGDSVDFKVIEDVKVDDIAIIPIGSIALGTVTESKGKHHLGRGGKLCIGIDFVWLPNGTKVPLHATKQARGAGHTELMTGAMIGTGLILLPAAPVFILMRGQDSTILQGTEVTAYTNGSISLDRRNLPAQRPQKPDGSAELTELSKMINLLPPRILDSEGNEGDMLNVIILASQEKLEDAFRQAEWIQVDRSKRKAALHMVKERQSYKEMPMSNLFFFGRSQDYGYAIAESMMTRRHHLRIWKTDFEIDGSPVWVGAGTHDIGLEKNKRNWTVTHKIDTNVDDEREFIASSLLRTHQIKRVAYVSPSDSVLEAFTATGGKYHSNGQLLLVELQ